MTWTQGGVAPRTAKRQMIELNTRPRSRRRRAFNKNDLDVSRLNIPEKVLAFFSKP